MRTQLKKYAEQMFQSINAIMINVRSLAKISLENLNSTTAQFIISLSSIQLPIIGEARSTMEATAGESKKMKCYETYGHIVERNRIWQLQKYSTECVEVFRDKLQAILQVTGQSVRDVWKRLTLSTEALQNLLVSKINKKKKNNFLYSIFSRSTPPMRRSFSRN